MENSINKIWQYMMEKLFCRKTNLFYDFFIPGKEGRFEEYLPTPDIINQQIPNPCGWCTGMEDGATNGSVMLESALKCYEYCRDERLIPLIKDIFAGLKSCASISSSEGFLARNISPVDGKSHYANSSRDQYTHWIFSACRYFESNLCRDEDRSFIQKTLCGFAKRAEKNVTPENNWSLLREDGKPGVVTGMWGFVNPHEAMRLPMFYLAAWKIGKDEHFKDLYYKYRDEALELSEKIVYEVCCRPSVVVQMQLSLRLIYDYDTDEAFRKRLLALMIKNAEYGYSEAIKRADENITPENLKQFSLAPNIWNETPAWLSCIADGVAYYTPINYRCIEALAPKTLWLIRDIGDTVSLYINSPDAEYKQELMDAIMKIADAIDFDNHYTDAPGYLLSPYYSLCILKEKKL